MGPTLNEITYDLSNIMRGGRTSDDEPVSLRQIGFWVRNTRAQLIRQDYNKGHSLSDNIISTINCLEMEQVNGSECCGIQTDCSVFRSVSELPKPIETWYGDLITKVSPIVTGSRPYQIVPMTRIPYMGHTPFTPLNNATVAVWHGGYIYIFTLDHSKVIKRVNLEEVAADPTELRTFNNCSGQACYTEDSPYPISAHMIETLKQMIINTNIKIISGAFTDNKGDANFEVEPNITK